MTERPDDLDAGRLSIAVVVPVHGGADVTLRCLDHLARQTRLHAVVVVDNASPDDTVGRIASGFPDVQIVSMGENAGFPRACNRGAASARGDVVVLLNNDVDCPPDFLDRLVRPLEAEPSLGSVVPVLVTPGRHTIDSVGLTVDRTLAAFPRHRGRPAAADAVAQAAPVLAGPTGAAAAYRRTAWEVVGGLDEEIFMYGEDAELALRLRAAGWGTAISPDAVAVHHGSVSAGHRSRFSRYHGGFARGYVLRRYGVLRGGAALRALLVEAAVAVGDAVLSRDLAALTGRLAGWRAARGLPRRAMPPAEALDASLGTVEALSLRRRSIT